MNLLLALLVVVSTLATEPPSSYTTTPFTLPPGTLRIVPADLDGDGLRELILVRAREFRIHRQGPDGFDLATPTAVLTTPEAAVGWDVVDVEGDGRVELVVLTDGREARAWSLAGGELQAPRLLAGELGAVVPGGFYHLSFIRDVDGDGDGDLIIPSAASFALHLRGADGAYTPGPRVPASFSLQQNLDGGQDLSSRIGQTLRVPLFAIRDVNGDGRVDLYAETEDRLEVFLADGAGGLGMRSSYAFDIASERQALGPFHSEDFDTANIVAPVTRTVQLVSSDVDGDGDEDLVFRAGGRVDLFLAGADGVDTSKASQRLKASGNVFAIACDDENQDGKPDLWIFRLETISLAAAMLWFVTPGSIDIDMLVYPFEEQRFARRPGRRIELKVKFPALLSLMNRFDDIELEVTERIRTAAHRADLDGAGTDDDVVVLEKAVLRGWVDRAGSPKPSLPWSDGPLSALGVIDGYSRDKNDYVIELDKIADLIPSPGAELIDAVRGRAPDIEIPVPGAGEGTGVILLDLNGDGRDDVLLLEPSDESAEGKPGAVRGAVLLSG